MLSTIYDEVASTAYVQLFGGAHQELIRTVLISHRKRGRTMAELIEPVCCGCHRHPHEIDEYIEMAQLYGITPEEYVRLEEGTYNPDNGHFWCSLCYIQVGMPLGRAK